MSGETLALVYLSAAKGIAYLGLIGMIGALGARSIVLPLCRRRGALTPQVDLSVSGQIRGTALVSAALLICAAGARVYAQTYSVFGLDERVTLELIQVVALETRWGGQWMPQFIASILVVVSIVASRVLPGVGRWLVAAAVGALAVTFPMTGHAMAHPDGTTLPWVLQVGHVLAAGVWLGILAVIVATVVASRSRPMPDQDRSIEALVNTFSPVALAAVVAVLATGTATAVLYLDHWRELWQTRYGLMLTGKVIVVLATGAVGAYNWRVIRPRMGTGLGRALLVRSAGLELALACVVLTLTAILVHLPMPSE
jgi:putative copper export protein